MRPHGSPEELERRRQNALALLNQGHQPVEVAKMVGVDRHSVRRWNAAYRRRGPQALLAKEAPGRPPKLNQRSKRKLEQALIRGAKAGGFVTDLWTCPRICHLIKTLFGVSYHVDHIGRLLRSMGWSPQRPERGAIERDEQEIQRWVKEQWPRVKKSTSPESLPGVPRRERIPYGAPGTEELESPRADTSGIDL